MRSVGLMESWPAKRALVFKVKYFRQFFTGVEWFSSLSKKHNNQTHGLWFYLKSPSHKCFQREIDKWAKIAIVKGVGRDFQRRLKVPLKRLNFFHVKSVVNELMSAYFFQEEMGYTIKEFGPSGYQAKKGDLLLTSPRGTEIFIEVKTPWEASF